MANLDMKMSEAEMLSLVKRAVNDQLRQKSTAMNAARKKVLKATSRQQVKAVLYDLSLKIDEIEGKE